MTALAVGVALAAAVAFGASTALMHHSASGAPRGVGGLLSLLAHLIRQWRWLAGMAASLSGLVLHALALHLGSLALVQPLVVSGLVLSFVFRAALDHHLPSRWMMTWVGVTAVGLTVFVVAVSSTTSSARLDGAAAAAVLVVGAAVAGLSLLASSRADNPRHTGLLLGVSAGVVFGLIAGTLKATTDAARSGWGLFATWPVYALVALGVTGFLLNQRAYHEAPLSSSLPALNTVNPLVAVVFGVAAFGERPSDQVVALLAECAGLAAVLAGVFFLARSEPVSAEA